MIAEARQTKDRNDMHRIHATVNGVWHKAAPQHVMCNNSVRMKFTDSLNNGGFQEEKEEALTFYWM